MLVGAYPGATASR